MVSVLKRLFGRTQKSASQPGQSSSGEAVAAIERSTKDFGVAPDTVEAIWKTPAPVAFTAATSVNAILQIEEVLDPEFFVGDLFRRRFGSNPPDYPRHFVAFYRQSPDTYHAAGFVHYSPFEDSFLCGGLVIDDRLYRKMPPDHRKLIRAAGGIAETMLRTTFVLLADAPVIWGYVGNKQSDVVTQRAGFVHTSHRHLMAVWNREMSEKERSDRLQRAVAIGPF